MELQKIKQLIDLLAASDLGEIELVEGGHRVRLVKRLCGADAGTPVAPSATGAWPSGRAADEAAAPPADPSDTHAPSAPDAGFVVTAPLFGIVHLRPAPDAPDFVGLGDTIQPGQTLCVVEAMKMFHEVKADRLARVDAILASAGQEIDAGAPLFRLAATD